jgi:hypothetical protein
MAVRRSGAPQGSRPMSSAARQLAVLLWLAGFLLVAFAWHAGTPMDAAALRPRIEQAHSLAAETGMLARQASERRLPPSVLARQAEQLLKHVRRAASTLAEARVVEAIRPVRDAAREPLLTVERALEQLAVGKPADRDALRAASGRLKAQATQLDAMAR